MSLGRRLALRPSIRRNRLCHSLWLTSASLPRRAAAIGRAALTSASSAGGFFKGEADPSARREPPPGLAQTALARTPTRNSSEPHSSGLLWKLYLGGAPRDSRAGACAPLRCCAPQRDLVCMHVPACACVCPRERGRVCEGAGVCAQMHCVRCASACVRPWVWRSWLWVARAHCHGQPGPAWQGSPAHMRTGISAGSCLSLERPTEGTHPQQVHRAASSGFPTSLLLLSFEGLVAWGKCGEEQSHKDTLFRAILFQ